MINPNSKRGRAMLLAAQTQERPAAPPTAAANPTTWGREALVSADAPVAAARPPLRENPARAYSLGDDDWGARRPVAKAARPAAAHDARARREARRQAVAAASPVHDASAAGGDVFGANDVDASLRREALRQAAASAPVQSPVVVAPVMEPVVAPKDTKPVAKRCFALEQPPQSISMAPDGSCVVAGFASGEVRLFDLTSTPQPEDRWGCALGVVGNINTSQGSLRVHVEISSDGKMLFAGARTGKGFRAWDLSHFHSLRDTRGFASVTRVRSYPNADARLRGLCSVATTSTGYRLLCGLGMGHMTVWDMSINGAASWACAFHEGAGGPSLLDGVLCAGGGRAITRVAEKPLRVWRLDTGKAEHHAIPDTRGDSGVLVLGGLEDRTTARGAVALLGMGCGELRATHLRDLQPPSGESGGPPLTADTIQLPPPPSGSSRRRQRSVQAVSACAGARACAVLLDDGHIALLTHDAAPTIAAWLEPRDTSSIQVTLGSVNEEVVAACVVFDSERSVGVLRYSSLAAAEAGSLRLLDDDATAVLDHSSSDNWEDRLAGGCWNCGGSQECWAPEARAVPCKRASTEPEAPPLKRRRSSTERVVDVTVESDEEDESKLKQQLQTAHRLLREAKMAHEEDLRRADRRFGEEKRLRKEWNDARRVYERRLHDAQSQSALLEAASRGGDRDMDAEELNTVHQKLTDALKRNRALSQRRAERDARGPNCVSCALRAPTVVFAPCGHRALCAGCEGELKRRDALQRCPCCKERVLATVHVRDLCHPISGGDDAAAAASLALRGA
jgi:WD40 repeat protein